MNYLTNKGYFKKLSSEDSISNINDYLLYGVVLGINSKVTNEMIKMIPKEQMNDVIYWYGDGSHGHNSIGGFANSFNSISSTLDCLTIISGTIPVA